MTNLYIKLGVINMTNKTIFVMLGLLLLSTSVFAMEPPLQKINAKETCVLDKPGLFKISEVEKFYKNFKADDWNSYNKNLLDSLEITASVSQSLKNYPAKNLVDRNVNTTWAVTNSARNNWLEIDIKAEWDIETTTPFTIKTIGIIPGYSKNATVWKENNRIKTARLIIQSKQIEPDAWSKYEYVSFKLSFPDKMGMHFFVIPDDKQIPNEPMVKKVWLIIDEVYKGSKYNDTCISEIAFTGGCCN